MLSVITYNQCCYSLFSDVHVGGRRTYTHTWFTIELCPSVWLIIMSLSPLLRHTIAHCILLHTVILDVGEENAIDYQPCWACQDMAGEMCSHTRYFVCLFCCLYHGLMLVNASATFDFWIMSQSSALLSDLYCFVRCPILVVLHKLYKGSFTFEQLNIIWKYFALNYVYL